jgi:hypothetical protein
MTNQELEQAITSANQRIGEFGSDEKISNREWRAKMQLRRELELLQKIRQARIASDTVRETKYLAHYNLLFEEKHMNPFIRYIMKLKLRSGIWM